jgi:hypothetical protein
VAEVFYRFRQSAMFRGTERRLGEFSVACSGEKFMTIPEKPFQKTANSSKELKSGFAPRDLYLCGSPREYPETKNPEPTGLETATSISK